MLGLPLRKLLSLVVISSLLCSPVFAGVNNIVEADGSPSVYPWKIIVSNGSLTDNGDGSATLVTGGGAGSTPTLPFQSIQFNDSGAFGGDPSLLWDKTLNMLTISRDSAQGGEAIRISSDTGGLLANISHDGAAMFQRISLQGTPLSSGEGGTGVRTNGNANALVYYPTTTTMGTLTADTTAGHVLVSTGTLPNFRQLLTGDEIGTMPVARGGTGITSGTSGAIPFFNSAGSMASTSLFAANAVVVGGGAGTAPLTITADTGVTHFLAATATSPAFRQILTSDLTGVLAAGQTSWIQYNTSGAFAADSTLSYDNVGGAIVFGGNVLAGHQSGANNRLLVSTPGSNAFISALNINNQSTGSSAGTGMLFTAGADSANIGGLGSTRTDASSNSVTGIRVLSNGSLTNADTSAAIYVSGATGGTTAALNGSLANKIGSGNGLYLGTSGTVSNITSDAATGHALFSRGGTPAFSQILTTDVSGVYPSTPAVPGGASTQFQYNNANVFAGATLITTDGIRFAVGPGTSTSVSMDVAGNFRTVPFVLADSVNITPDATRSNFFTVTLAGAPRTLSAPTGGVNGQKIIIRISQDATGSRKIGTAVGIKYGSDVPSFDATTTAGNKDYLVMVCNSNTASWDVVGISKGYN